MTDSLASIARDLRQHLEFQMEKGVRVLKGPGHTNLMVAPESLGDLPNTTPSLPQIRQDLGDCKLCGLCSTRTNIVFGEGPESAQVAFVGEAPGADEDLTAKPFQGESGQLLDKMLIAMEVEAQKITKHKLCPGLLCDHYANHLDHCKCGGDYPCDKALSYARSQVYIANVIKCRPPGNRKPDPEEIQQCQPFLERQLTVLANLKCIVTLGKTPADTLLGLNPAKSKLSDIRGQWQEWRGIPLMPTWHPAYLLRMPSKKGECWEDLKRVIEKLGGR